MQTNQSDLQNAVDNRTSKSSAQGAQKRAADQSLPNAQRYSKQIFDSQFSDRTDPRK